MISMPPTYLDQLKGTGIVPDTLFNYPEVRDRSLNYNMLALYMVDGTAYGHFRLHYMLKSFKRVTDNQEFGLIMVTSNGIFREVDMHFEYNIPFEFQTMVLQKVCDIKPGTLVTNIPDSRKIMVVNVDRYTEIINDYAYPNTFYFEDQLNSLPEPVVSHKLMIETSDYKEPLILEYSRRLCFALRNQIPYIHLRSDQYVDIKDIRFWHMSF